VVKKIKDEYKSEINEIRKEVQLKHTTKKEAMEKIKNIRGEVRKEFQRMRDGRKADRESRKAIHDKYKNN